MKLHEMHQKGIQDAKETITKSLIKCADLPIQEGVYYGLDLGIASCGWALIDVKNGKVIDMGVWCFEKPEDPKTKETLASARRVARGQRRRLHRRKQRMHQLRKLFYEQGLLQSAAPPKDEKGKPVYDPWKIRTEGLDRALTKEELAYALLHIAKHRGFRSNSKTTVSAPAKDTNPEEAQKAKENKKALAGMKGMEDRLQQSDYRTIGEMMFRDKEFDGAFGGHKRNKEGQYGQSIRRTLLEEEVEILFDRQREFSSNFATRELAEKYIPAAFDQRPLQNSDDLLGNCSFEKKEKRASSCSYSFELFRYLSKLSWLEIQAKGENPRRLTTEELKKATQDFGKTQKITFANLRKLIGLSDDTTFANVDTEKKTTKKKATSKKVSEKPKEDRDVVADTRGATFGSSVLRKVVGDSFWQEHTKTPEKQEVLDKIAHFLTFREYIDDIREGLEEISSLEKNIVEQLMENVGKFATFSRPGHISTKAARKIQPHFFNSDATKPGYVYSKACERAGYNHSEEASADLVDITSPTARRAILESLKQTNAVLSREGYRPEKIHVELARDVGKGPATRKEIEQNLKERTYNRDNARAKFEELLYRRPSNEELLRYELWEEQKHRCIYSDQAIDPHELLDGKNQVQVDHILPRSQSHDNTRNNVVLCKTDENQNKKNKIPHQYFGHDEERWKKFEATVKSLYRERSIKGFKSRNLLITTKEFEEQKDMFLDRNLNDTRIVTKTVLAMLELLYLDNSNGSNETEKKTRHLFARPGHLTAILRRSWGLDRFKYIKLLDNNKKERIEDERHHAIDAAMCAVCSEGMLQKLTKEYQYGEDNFDIRLHAVPGLKPPWGTKDSFMQDIEEARKKITVARSESRRGRGQGHEATTRAYRDEIHAEKKGKKGEEKNTSVRVVYERKAVDKTLTLKHLERIKDPERNKDLIDAVTTWIDSGKPKDSFPKRNNGVEIRKITLRTEINPLTERSGIVLNETENHRGGIVDNASMVRLDVFEKKNKKGVAQFYLVPIYTHQIADKKQYMEPPKGIISSAGKPEKDWDQIDETYTFRFSLYPFSYIELDRRGEILEGYYRSCDRAGGKLTISDQKSRTLETTSIGAKTLRSFRKFHIDRFGQKHEIKQEQRTWHGAKLNKQTHDLAKN